MHSLKMDKVIADANWMIVSEATVIKSRELRQFQVNRLVTVNS